MREPSTLTTSPNPPIPADSDPWWLDEPLGEWDDGFGGDWLVEPDEGQCGVADPTEDPTSDFSEPLYPPDHSVTNLTLSLKIDEFLAGAKPITQKQNQRCFELLEGCGTKWVGRNLTWLREQKWNGSLLQLFLEFREHWKSHANYRWWESLHWNAWMQRWVPSYQPNLLTHALELDLISQRPNSNVHGVIDAKWHMEWEENAPWEMGVTSFANFALFRARIPEREDWREYLLPEGSDDLGIGHPHGPTDFALITPSTAEQYGFHLPLTAEPDSWLDVWESARRVAERECGNWKLGWHAVLNGGTYD